MLVEALDAASVLLRIVTYVATIAVAGTILFAWTSGLACKSPLLHRQIMIGAMLLIACEPLRYAIFQLSIAQGDLTLAFGPSMRWLGLETPIGQAALARLTGLGIALLGLAFGTPLAVIGALAIVAAFLLEGHPASSEGRYVSIPLHYLHVLAAHWWLAALMPLRSMLGRAERSASEVAGHIERFARQALAAVGVLCAAGAILFLSLIGWTFDLAAPYQQAFLLKFGVFLLILLVAAINKLKLTPLLSSNPAAGRRALHRSISLEIAVAFVILAATAIMITFPPADH